MRMWNDRKASTGVPTLAIAAATAALSAGAAYLFDSQSGERRRALINDQLLRGRLSIRDKRQRNGKRQLRIGYREDNWSQTPRLLAGLTGAALTLGGAASRSKPGAAVAVAGAALLMRSVTNKPISKVLGFGADAEDGVQIEKTIHVYAEPSEVYDTWRDLESFPRFMSHVRDVRRLGRNRYHWVVDGPGRASVEWDAEITVELPDEMIAWRTLEGSEVQSSGIVRFEPSSYGGTLVHVRMSYRPPANLVGHGVAKIFGADPKRRLDEDLSRFKIMMETGSERAESRTEARH